MEFIAHIRNSENKEIQSVKDHLLEAKSLAEEYGTPLGIKHLTGLAGLLHDLGKATNQFKDYITEAVNNPNNPPKRGSVDHSTAGGKFLYDLYHNENNNPFQKLIAEIVGNAIISHHSYLQDFLSPRLESNYLKRVKEKEIQNYPKIKEYFFNQVMSEEALDEYVGKACEEVRKFVNKITSHNKEGYSEAHLMYLTKFVFSALIDADRTNTRQFEEKSTQTNKLDTVELFKAYYSKLMDKLVTFENKTSSTRIDDLRKQMSEQCEAWGYKESGIYTLSIPTGGGKTLSSFRYALRHAIEHNKKKIIYIVPFTTIIEQNAQEIKKIVKDDEHVLEHHSNVISEFDDSEDFDGTMSMREKVNLAKDNWDTPIVFSTMVQFLDQFYASGARNIRRLHNFADSIIIFDEVQKVPTQCVSLFNEALNYLNFHCNTSILLCTATQPALDYVKHKLDINPEAEIISDIDEVNKQFKRVEIIDKATKNKMNTKDLSHFILENTEKFNNQLVILNTKKVVKELYKELNELLEDYAIYHLSTSMCATHRTEILNEVKLKLENKEKVICVTTQLIEAGVDISFECVIRSLSGLDSIAQAAGRCNRHAEKDIGKVFLVDHGEETTKFLKEIEVGKDITSKMLKDLISNSKNHGGDLLSKQAMNFFFKNFYSKLAPNLEYPIRDIGYSQIDLLMKRVQENEILQEYKSKHGKIPGLFNNNSIGTAAKKFNVINNDTTSILVPYGYGKEIIKELNGFETLSELSNLFKQAQLFSVNLYSHELKQLIQEDALVDYFEGAVLALKESYYSNKYGLNLEGEEELSFNMF